MKANEVLNYVSKTSGFKQAEVARKLGISRSAACYAFASKCPGLDLAAKYLKAMGYQLVAMPDTVDVPAIFTESFRIEPEEKEPEEKEPEEKEF